MQLKTYLERVDVLKMEKLWSLLIKLKTATTEFLMHLFK